MVPLASGLDRLSLNSRRAMVAVSLLLGFLGAQSFYIPAMTYAPILFSVKDALASLGASELFSRDLPLATGWLTPLATFTQGGISSLFADPAAAVKLFSAQLFFTAP
jgi:hypothetical protein